MLATEHDRDCACWQCIEAVVTETYRFEAKMAIERAKQEADEIFNAILQEDTMPIPLSQQIEEVETELRMRGQVYPGMVSRQKMRQGEADYKIERMKAVRATLLWLQENEQSIRQRLSY